MLKKAGVILGAFAYAALAGMTADQQDQILYGQNKARSEKGITTMLKWDASAAAVAQAYSDQCNWGHNGNRGNYGENIAAGSTPYTPIQANQGWIDGEYPSGWQCGTITGSNYNHYTQVMWAATTGVGCGITYCNKNSPFGSSFPSWTYIVCDYSPPGNYLGQAPYPTSQCNSKAPCTPQKTCTQAGGSFNDPKCGQINCGSSPSPTPAPTAAPSSTTVLVNGNGALQNGWGSYIATNAGTKYNGLGGTVLASSQGGKNYFFLSAPSNAPRSNWNSIRFTLTWDSSSDGATPSIWFFWNGQGAVALSLAGSGQSKSFAAAIPSGIASSSQLPLAVWWNAGSSNANIYVSNVYLSTSAVTGADGNSTEADGTPEFQQASKNFDATAISTGDASRIAATLVVVLATILSLVF